MVLVRRSRDGYKIYYNIDDDKFREKYEYESDYDYSIYKENLKEIPSDIWEKYVQAAQNLNKVESELDTFFTTNKVF